MSGLDWAGDRQRSTRRALKNQAAYERARNEAQALRATEQRTYLRFARQHAHQNGFCAQIAGQGFVSRAQANVLRRIAQERGWKIGGPSGRTRRANRRPPNPDPGPEPI